MCMTMCPQSNLWVILNKLIKVTAVTTIHDGIMCITRMSTESTGCMMAHHYKFLFVSALNHTLNVALVLTCSSNAFSGEKRPGSCFFFMAICVLRPCSSST
jgi:hypothetical protein